MNKNKSLNVCKNNNLIIIELIIVLILIGLLTLSVKGIIYLTNNNAKTIITSVTTISKNNSNEKNNNSLSNLKIEILNYNEISYYIKVNIKTQTVTVYTYNQNNEYIIPVKTMLCSTGISTPETGVFTISDKYEWAYLVGNVYGQYATRITGPILFHSVPYTKQDKASLEYWEYDKLGQPVSKGCVRLTVKDAKWIYDYCKPGTKVEFVNEEINSSQKLEVKSEMKISEYSDYLKCWDPTDPDEDNPWKEYKNQYKGENN